MPEYTVSLSVHLKFTDPDEAREVRRKFDTCIQKHLPNVSSYDLRGYNYADGMNTTSAPAVDSKPPKSTSHGRPKEA